MLEGNNYSKAQIKAGEPQKQPTLWVMMMIIFFFLCGLNSCLCFEPVLTTPLAVGHGCLARGWNQLVPWGHPNTPHIGEQRPKASRELWNRGRKFGLSVLPPPHPTNHKRFEPL